MKPIQPFPFEEFKKLYSKVPRLCVDLVIQGPDGLVLSQRKIPPNKGQWHLPGGTVFFKEPLHDAVVRVAKVELGIEIKIKEFLGYIEFLKQDRAGGFDYPVSLVFSCETEERDFRADGQASDIKSFSSLPTDMIPEQRDFLVERGL